MTEWDLLFREFTKDELEVAYQEILQIKKDFSKHVIPERYPDAIGSIDLMTHVMHNHMDDFRNNGLIRDYMIKDSSWCLVSKSWIRELLPMLKGKKVLEIMSGCGMLAKAFQDEGIDVIATDSYTWYRENFWTEVDQLDAVEAIKKYGKEVDYVLCSWMPYQCETDLEILKELRNHSLPLIFIGEWGGCNASTDFIEAVEEIDNECIDKANQHFQQWAGIHDRIYLFK